MKTLNFLKIWMLCVLSSLVWTSCGDDVSYYTMQNSDEKLCAHTWAETYTDEDEEGKSVLCEHQLIFSRNDNSGQEKMLYYHSGETRPYREVTDNFNWEWFDESMEGLRLDFGAGQVKHFENVWVREHYLQGKLDGRIVMMTDINYNY